MAGVPYTFSTATAPIPLSELDANFNTTLTIGGTSIGLGNTTSSLANVTFTGTTTLPGSGAISSAGLLGIGMTPSNVLDITQNQNAASAVSILNNSSGTSAAAEFIVNNGTHKLELFMYGASYTPSGLARADGARLVGEGAGGVTIDALQAQPIYFGINGSEVARFDASGNFKRGYTGAAAFNLIAATTNNEGDTILDLCSSSVAYDCFRIYIGNTSGFNAAATVATIYKNSSNSRSINAAGTINASGADYAEYMTKADGCGVIPKGAIAGVNADGKLTDKFDDAHSFVIKSTDPSYVGGDTWGSHEALGLESPDKEDPDYKEKEAAIAVALEAARQKVDRIAFSGQVPVNVTGATVGDYIVPVAGPDGGITGNPVTNPTFDQYRAAVGRVWKILEDGRAFVSVKVS
jgi:hypothetical protein